MSEYVVGKNPCPKCRAKGADNSGDNFTYYGEGQGGYCFSCGYVLLSDARKEELGIGKYEYDDEECMTKELLTPEEVDQIKSYTGTDGQDSRGISNETYKAYACRFKYSEETGEVVETFYPYTQDYKAAGYKVRQIPKDFYTVGKVGKNSELFGQWKWKECSPKYILVTAGELDCLSAFQMLENYRKSKGSDFDATPVVSSGIGETASFKQIQLQYNWLNQAQRVVVCYDNDEAGKEAIKKLVDVIPKGKMFVMKLTLKDANEYLVKGKEKQFLRAFYDAPAYTPTGIVGSGSLSSLMRDEISNDKISFPPYMRKVNEMTGGGLALGKICNIGAASGLGKTVYVDSIIYHLIFNSPYLCGVVSMELNAGQYGVSMLSRHIGRKISNIENKDERIAFLESEPVKAKEQELFYREDGTHRWFLVDDRDGSIKELQAVVEQLVISCGCKLIVLDPIQDILDGLTNEDQALFLKWQKGMIKSHNISFININHVRKSGGGGKQNSEGNMISEEDFAGSSTIFKSAALNILLVRDKMNEDEFVRNTTKAFISKNRDNGMTGPCGEYFYDNATHTLWDKDEYLEKHPGEF